MLKTEELLELIARGESSSVELKSADLRAESLARELVALANSAGGLVILGVRDDGSVEGVPEARRFDEWVANIARNNVVPALAVRVDCVVLEDKPVVVLDVPKGRDKPYQTRDGRFLIRVGSTNRIASQPELMRLFQAAGTFHFDGVPLAGTGLRDLDLGRVDTYFRRYDVDFSAEDDAGRRTLLTNSDIMAASDNVTVGGLLLFGLSPSRHLPQSGITFAHFRGTDLADELIDKQNIDGTLSAQVDTCLAVIKNNLQTPSRIRGARRENLRPAYPDRVFRELATNACVHRNYSIAGSKVRVLMFRDRIEFISPGRLPNTVTVEKLRFGVSYAVNPILVKFMENMGYVDQLGRGLPMVFRDAARLGLEVEFREVGEDFKVVLPLPPLPAAD